MKIYFKGFRTLKISNEVALQLSIQITEGCKQWQIYSEDGKPYMLINLSEILYIK